jgi:putative ABC transport system ATP-binding protein
LRYGADLVEDRQKGHVVRATDIWKEYDGGDGTIASALRGTTLEIHPGEAVAIFGKSGSGKTTLLNILAGLDYPTRGTVEVDGRDLQKLGEHGRTELRRKRIGFIFQFFNLLPTLTAFENVFLSLELAGTPDGKKVLEVLRSVGLEGKESRYPHELSGGEQQRVAVARAIVKEPVLVLADEPTGNLDTSTGDQVLRLLSGLCRNSLTSLIMVTHTPLTCRYADKILRMVDGVIVESPSCEGLDR